MAKADQVRCGVVGALEVVDFHSINLDAGHHALEDDDGGLPPQYRGKVVGGETEGNTDQTVDPAREEIPEVIDFTGQGPAGVTEDDAVTPVIGCRLNARRHFGEEGDLDAGDKEPDGECFAPSQTARHDVRVVVELIHGVEDTCRQRRAYGARVVDDMTNGRSGDCRQIRDL